MRVMIKYINHPKHGPVWYGVLFGVQAGAPYLIECRYRAAHSDLPNADGTPPHPGIEEYILEQIKARCARMGVTPENYPELDKPRKPRDVDICNEALRHLGQRGISPGQQAMNDLNELIKAQAWADLHLMQNIVTPPTGFTSGDISPEMNKRLLGHWDEMAKFVFGNLAPKKKS